MKVWIAYMMVRTWNNMLVKADIQTLPIQRLTYGYDFRWLNGASYSKVSDADYPPYQLPNRSLARAVPWAVLKALPDGQPNVSFRCTTENYTKGS
jgi:hypothetical protein